MPFSPLALFLSILNSKWTYYALAAASAAFGLFMLYSHIVNRADAAGYGRCSLEVSAKALIVQTTTASALNDELAAAITRKSSQSQIEKTLEAHHEAIADMPVPAFMLDNLNQLYGKAGLPSVPPAR